MSDGDTFDYKMYPFTKKNIILKMVVLLAET